jgi:hypothetical protein
MFYIFEVLNKKYNLILVRGLNLEACLGIKKYFLQYLDGLTRELFTIKTIKHVI